VDAAYLADLFPRIKAIFKPQARICMAYCTQARVSMAPKARDNCATGKGKGFRIALPTQIDRDLLDFISSAPATLSQTSHQ
jgi:hypothetical protein